MLTRLKFKRDFRIVVRCLADKPSDDGKVPVNQTKEQGKDKKTSENATERIQELLKSMMAAPKTSETEYREKFATAPEIPRRRMQKDEISVKMEKIEESITKAASDVAQAMGGDVKQTEAELLSRVLGKINQTSTSLSDLLVGMKVDRTKEPDDAVARETRGQHVKRLVEKNREQKTRFTQRKAQQDDSLQTKTKDGQVRPQPRAQPASVNVFSGTPLGIFAPGEPHHGTMLDTWEALRQRELTLATSRPPINYFEKMIVWTQQGKVWKFPIDNEQGLEDEKNVHFSEHIFLDAHLEGWCPKKGPIRHFMELVCVGLSKNAFYTVKEKKEHIMWYKEYFESKKDLLSEVGAWEPKSSSSETSLNRKKFHNLLEKCSSPDDKWKLYDIDKVFYETDDLDKAKKKLKIAEDTSDLQTDATEVEYEPKRRITKNHRYVSSDDEQQEGDLIRPQPLKKICKENKTLSSPVPVIEVIGNEYEAMNISLSGQQKQLDTNCFNEVVIFNEDGFDETICNKEAKNDKTISINNLMDTSLLLNNVEDLFPTSTPKVIKYTGFQEKVISLLSYIKNQNTQILTILKGTIETADLDSCFDFPVKSEEGVKTTEEILKNVDKYKNLVNYIKSFGGHGVSNKVSRAMKSLLLDSVAAKYNFCGKRSNKKAFSELRLHKCLVDAIICSKLGITARHVEDHIKVWLKHAPERNKTRNVSTT